MSARTGTTRRTAEIAAALQAASQPARAPTWPTTRKAEIRICAGTACHASGRVALRKAVEAGAGRARPRPTR